MAKFRDVLVGDSKIQTALSKLKGGVVVTPPKLVTTGMDVRARNDLAIRWRIQSDILNNVVPRAGVMVCTSGSTGEISMQATLRMSGVFTDDESSAKLLDLLKTAPGILGTTKAFTEALKCTNANKEVERSDGMPLVDIPYEVEEAESAEEAAKRLEHEKQALQKLLDETLKAQEDAGKPKRSRADADDPAMGESAKVSEQGKQAKAEADKLVDKANKQVIYGRIDACLTEYDTRVRSFASTMAWFNSGRTKVREMVAAQAKEVSQEKAARVANVEMPEFGSRDSGLCFLSI